MAEGLVKKFPGPIKPIIEMCLERDINIFQMPCPETLSPHGGLGRQPRGRSWYEARGLRDSAREIAEGQADYMRLLTDNGVRIVAVIGLDFSPACAVNYLNRGRAITKSSGIFVEELRTALRLRELDPPFVGISPRWEKKMRRELIELFEAGQDDSRV